MNYINKDKNYMTDEERIKYLEESLRELRIEKDRIRKEKGEVRQRLVKVEEENKIMKDKIEHLEFDIEAWKRLKSVWENREQKLQIEIGGLMGERDGLKIVVDRLHKEIEEQESEGQGLFDEIEYRKREAKKLGWKPNN